MPKSSGQQLYRKLDMNALMSKKGRIVSSEEALKDVTPPQWSQDVLAGMKRVEIHTPKKTGDLLF